MTAAVLVIGLGNPYRGDDGVGVAVVDRVARRLAEAPGPPSPAADSNAGQAVQALAGVADPLDLLGRWDGAELAVVVDAARSGAPAGTVVLTHLDDQDHLEDQDHEDRDAHTNAAPDAGGGHLAVTSTHGFGLVAAVRLSRALESAPHRIVLVTVEGSSFGHATTLSPRVAAAVEDAATRVLDLLDARVGPPG